MKIQHNIAGIENLGEIDFQKRVFVVPWEERIFGIHVAMMALSSHLDTDSVLDYSLSSVPTNFKSTWTWGHLRKGAEGLNPLDYFKFRYYEKWLGGISGYFIDEGYITEEELDAKYIQEHWSSSEAQEQIAFADVILVNKTDLVSTEELETLSKKIRSLNAIAKIQLTQNCNIDIDFVLGISAFDLKNALSIDPQFLDEDAHEHDQTVASIAIANKGIVNGDKLNRWLNQLVQALRQDIFRMKGILNVDDEDRRFVFQGVHMTLDGRPGKPWKPDEIKTNELIFIGRNLGDREFGIE